MLFSSVTECYLQQLGPPHTPQEWMMVFISAVAERCLGTPLKACNRDPACTVVSSFYPEEAAELAAALDPTAWLRDWLDNKGLKAEDVGVACYIDVLRVLGKPCKGSHGDLLVRCGGHATAGHCRRDKACLWLRNGWWLEPESHQTDDQQATLFTGEKIDVSVALQGGIPPSYACWPKWHVPRAAQAWPDIQFKSRAVLACPALALDFPCTFHTEASLTVLKVKEINTTLVKQLSSTTPCIDIVGIKGTCPHLDLALQVVARLWNGWQMPFELWTNLTKAIIDVCEPVASKLRVNHSHHTFQMAAPRALMVDPGSWQHMDDIIGTNLTSLQHLYGSDCTFDLSYFASYTPVDLPMQCRDVAYTGLWGRRCNRQTVDERRSKDNCVNALVAVGLWREFAGAILVPASKAQSGFWLQGLAQAGQRCGTLVAWYNVCSHVDGRARHANLSKLIDDYEKLFLVHTDAAEAVRNFNVTYACKAGMAAAYKSLAAVWVAYAGLLAVGLVGLSAYWHCCSHRRRLRAHRAAAVALQRLLASMQDASTPGASAHQHISIMQRALHAVHWAMPRIRAIAFALDFGLDVYMLVELWLHSRWFGQLLSAIFLPYVVLALLLAPGRSDYPRMLCCIGWCSWMFLPVLWWFDVRMLFTLMGVQLPHCEANTLGMASYTDLRMLFEGVFEALPSALISTAVLYDQFGVQSGLSAIPVALCWLNLVSSFSRGLLEVWRLAVLTHTQGNRCFMTTIANMVWDTLPPDESPNVSAGQTPGQGSAQSQTNHGAANRPTPPGQPDGQCSATAITVAPRPVVMTPSQAQQWQQPQQLGPQSSTQTEQQLQQQLQQQATLKGPQDANLANLDKGVLRPTQQQTQGENTPASSLRSGCECCSGCICAASKCSTKCWVLAWVWFWTSTLSIIVVLLCVSIGCVGLLVQDGVINLGVVSFPRYRFAGDATCGAGSLFGALHSGASASCTLPNHEGYSV